MKNWRGRIYIRLNRKSASELIPKDAENDEVTDTYYIYWQSNISFSFFGEGQIQDMSYNDLSAKWSYEMEPSLTSCMKLENYKLGGKSTI